MSCISADGNMATWQGRYRTLCLRKEKRRWTNTGCQPRRDGRAGSVPLPHGTFSTLSAEAEYELRHPDYVMEMPQSGERIRGRDKMREFQEAYPNPPSIIPRRVAGSGDVWVIEARSDYGDGQIFHVAMIV